MGRYIEAYSILHRGYSFLCPQVLLLVILGGLCEYNVNIILRLNIEKFCYIGLQSFIISLGPSSRLFCLPLYTIKMWNLSGMIPLRNIRSWSWSNSSAVVLLSCRWPGPSRTKQGVAKKEKKKTTKNLPKLVFISFFKSYSVS